MGPLGSDRGMRMAVVAGLLLVAVSAGVIFKVSGDNPARRNEARRVAATDRELPESVAEIRPAHSSITYSETPGQPESVTLKTALKPALSVANKADQETSSADSAVIDEAEPNPLREIGQQLRNHPGDFAKLFEQLQTETNPDKIALLAKLIAENAVEAGIDLPVKQMLDMLQDPMPEKRDAALAILSLAEDVTPEMISSVGSIAQKDADNRVRMSAIGAMGSWLNGDSSRQEVLSRELIQVRDSTRNNEVRGYAIQTIGLQKHGLPASMIEPMTQSLQHERNADNRSIAALALSHVADANRATAVQALEQAYQKETDLDTRRHMITMIMRTAGNEAVTVLGRLNTDQPLLKQDVADYVEIIRQGETDVDRIFELKNSRDGDRGTEPSKDPN